ncbi:MAG: hypothetical protein LC791_00075 [Acidobacteria bacterium]|nr:hypothetical protein [Acidobacteriota bacterium]
MNPGRAVVEGLTRVQRAPALLAGMWLTTVLVALPFALTLNGMIASHLGASLAAEAAADGVNFDWWNEFTAQATGIGQTFVPPIIGFAAPLGNLSELVDAEGLPVVVAPAVALHMAISAFLMGGVLDRLARNRATGSHAFFAASGVFFFRFLRLAIAAVLVYGFLFTTLHVWLFDTLYVSLTRDLAVERTAFVYRLLGYTLFATLLLAVNLVFDYAKIRAVVEDRRSMLGALTAAVRFVVRNRGATIGLYLMNAGAFAAVLFLYYVLAPSVGQGAGAWLVLLVGQLYIVLRVALRLQFAGSQIALFQSRLAHAAYTATPTPLWPESPAAESIGRVQRAELSVQS